MAGRGAGRCGEGLLRCALDISGSVEVPVLGTTTRAIAVAGWSRFTAKARLSTLGRSTRRAKVVPTARSQEVAAESWFSPRAHRSPTLGPSMWPVETAQVPPVGEETPVVAAAVLSSWFRRALRCWGRSMWQEGWGRRTRAPQRQALEPAAPGAGGPAAPGEMAVTSLLGESPPTLETEGPDTRQQWHLTRLPSPVDN